MKKDTFELASWRKNQVICGVDEVGRGCLAGPLVVAAVILPVNPSYPLLKDSKILSGNDLRQAYHWITRSCHYSIVPLHHRAIDRHNIYRATLKAMKRAITQLCATAPRQPVRVLVDAMPLTLADTGLREIPVTYFNKGESISRSIAAASIIAKVHRDALITQYNEYIPGYHLHEHKGYGTQKHKEAIATLGSSFIHRTSFLSKVVYNHEADAPYQQRFC